MKTGQPVLIPAAGHGTRMGGPKLFISHQGKTFLEHILDRCRESRSPVTLAIDRFFEAEARRLLDATDYEPPRLVTANGALPMLSTIKAALRLGAYEPGFWLWPVDAPFLSAKGWETAVETIDRDPNVIWKLKRAGKTGHPIWFPFHTIPAIIRGSWENGLRGFIAETLPERIQVLALEGEMLEDLNTPEDLEKLNTNRNP